MSCEINTDIITISQHPKKSLAVTNFPYNNNICNNINQIHMETTSPTTTRLNHNIDAASQTSWSSNSSASGESAAAMGPALAAVVSALPEVITPAEVRNIRALYSELGVQYAPLPHDDDRVANVRHVARHFVDIAPEGQEQDAFYVVDLGQVVLQMAKWRRHLPMVRPFYAMKCNPNIHMLRMLSAMGAGFDCASQPEFMTVLEHGLAPVDDIIFANPCKQVAHMKKAHDVGVRYVTFDNEAELHKIKRHMPNAKCVLRIATNDTKSVCQFSVKFGCPWTHYPRVVQLAHELGIDLVGVSFHVGSGCRDATVHVESAKVARDIFTLAENTYGFRMELLDIGGGFPGVDHHGSGDLTFEHIARNLAPYLEEHFRGYRVIAEPGRYFAEPFQALAMTVYAKRRIPMKRAVDQNQDGDVVVGEEDSADEEEVQYYVNDGVYHSFNCVIFDHAHPKVCPMDPAVDANNSKYPTSTMYGPTCDSMDCVFKRVPFPEVEIGDWLVVPDFGAYTTAAGTNFNGFATTRFELVSCVAL
eukprot:PhM_4_TR752/c1_g1_i2/m.95605/K01581/E4.1.1.17, ODC1, speC, speF; ornithine decarboxylase